MPRSVSVRLLADVSNFTKNVGGAAVKSVRDLSGELDKTAKAGHLDSVIGGLTGVGVGLAGVAGFAVKASMDFEKSMSKVKAATHGSSAEMELLRKAALQAGKDTQFSATGAADAITELSKASVSTSDILGGGLKGALDLAAAGQLEVGEAAETAASAMTQFKLQGKDVPHIADLLAAGAGKAQGSVHDMGQALNQAGLIASQTGLSIEETTGGLAAFANAGLIGSDAGTSFKQMLLMLQAPSDKSRALMDELGISLYDSSGQFVGLTKFAGQLQGALKNLTPEARSAALAQIFGADATRAASIMYEQGAAGVESWIGKVNDAGYASETAAALTDNLAGDLERLKGSLETLAIEAGSGANGGLRDLVQMLEGVVDWFGELPPIISNSLTVMAGVGGVAAIAAGGWLKARQTSAQFREELEKMGPAGTRAATGLQRVNSAAGKTTLVFAALSVAGELIAQFQDDLNPKLDAMAAGLEKYAAGGELAGEASRVLGDDMGKLRDKFAFLADEDNSRREAVKNLQGALEFLIPGLKGTDESLANTKNRIEAMDAALAQLASSGNTQAAQQAFQKLASELAVGGVSMDEFKKQFPQYAAALEVAGKSTKDAASKTDEFSQKLEAATKEEDKFENAAAASSAAIRGQRDALVDLSEYMKGEVDPVFGLISAQDKLTKAQKAASDAIKEHGRKSSEAKAATRELALAAIGLQGAVGALGDKFDGKMTPALRNTLKAAGLTEKQIKDLEGQFKSAKTAADKYDDKYEARASAPGAKQAKTDLDKAYTSANKFAGPYKADVSVTGDKGVNKALDQLLVKQYALAKGMTVAAASASVQKDLDRNKQKKYHSGGRTPMIGEREPAGIVHGKEMVLNAATVRKIDQQNPGFLDEVHATGGLPGFWMGGRVGPFKTNVSKTDIPTWEEVAAKVIPAFNGGGWPSSPSAVRYDSGRWRMIRKWIEATGPLSGSFGNGYRPGDPKWHGSGWAVDWMGFNQDALASRLAALKPLELIHRSNQRDYAYTRGVNKGSFNESLMNAHRNHIHIAMANGGVINEPVFGWGASGRSYSFGERGSETVTPGVHGAGGATVVNVNLVAQLAAGANPAEHGRQIAQYLERHFANGGEIRVNGQQLVGVS